MLFLADENVDGDLLRALIRREEHLDVLRAVNVGLAGCSDDDVLQWAANESRIVLTQDVATMPPLAWERVTRGLPMPGVIVVSSRASIALVVGDLLLLVRASEPDEWTNRVLYLPFS